MTLVIPVTKSGITYALFVAAGMKVDPLRFVTDQRDEFQVGFMERQAGYAVKPHMHLDRNLTIKGTAEFLYVQEGKMAVTVYDEAWNELHRQEVATGDCMVFLAGGHSMTMLEKTRLIEVKQGPYPGEAQAKVYK